MSLERTHFGQVYTHLNGLLENLVSAVVGGRINENKFKGAASNITQDPVFTQISAGRFRAPVPKSPLTDALNKQLQRLRDIAHGMEQEYKGQRDFIENIFRPLDTFINNDNKQWDEKDCYFIIPVLAKAGKKEQAGMVYLRSDVLGPGEEHGNRIKAADLTKDETLQAFAEDYFGQIASVLMKTLYFVQTYPFSTDATLTNYRYRLLFGCQITEGKSMGAAVLALFAMAHLQNVLGTERFKSVIAPRRGTVLTGEIGRDGSVLPVEGIRKKIECAYREFGPNMKVILPTGEPLPDSIKIDRGNLYHVSTAEELLAAVLSSDDGHRGLDEARTALFQKLTQPQKDVLMKVVRPGIDPEVFDQMAAGRVAWMTPKRYEGGVYAISKAWHNRLDIRISLEPSGLQDEDSLAASGRSEQKYLELVQVILDGSHLMDAYWEKKDTICRMTEIVYEIAGNIDPKRQELVCGFLSHQTFYPIKFAMPAQEIETKLQKIRDENKLQYIGSFFRPIYEESVRKFARKLKRIYLISDAFIPDLYDLSDLNVSSFTRFFISPSEEDALSGERQLVLFPDGLKMDKNLLHLFFHKEEGTIDSLQIDFGESLPFEWDHPGGDLIERDNHYIAQWQNIRQLKFGTRIQMAGQYPHSVKISAKLRREGAADDFHFTKFHTISTLKSLISGKTGHLTDEEFALWQTITSPGPCPQCGQEDVHLFHEDELRVLGQNLIFKRLNKHKNGFLLFQQDARDWRFFSKGYQLNGITFVFLNGELHWSQARGHIEKVPREDLVYHLRSGDKAFYLGKV